MTSSETRESHYCATGQFLSLDSVDEQAGGFRELRCGLYASATYKYSLKRQHARLERLVQKLGPKLGARCVIADRYGDDLREPFEFLPADLTRLLGDIENGYVNCVVVTSVDRITRSIDRLWLLINELEAKGVKVIAADYPQLA